MHNRLYFHQQPQIAEVLVGKWESEEKDETAVFEKNNDTDKPLLIIKNERGVWAECDAQEDSRNVFNCIFEPDKGDKNKFDVLFAISHYYKDKVTIYYSLEPNVLDRCIQDDACEPEILATLEREVEHDNKQNYY